ncbi:MAG: bifunctional ornithine acetyltransferase/N-acetylglutamate synthase [Clostridia bacterium]|nr:bifunctional ornithine acetyltransferase/N-acetylglutamate synthase [Clostridia bacterium]
MTVRKNAVNRELTPIPGGVCAPDDFRASSAACGFKQNGELDLGVIVSKRRCPTACVYTTSAKRGAPILITERHLENEYAHAIVVNGGIANTFQFGGERLAKDVCRIVENYCNVITEDVVVASTGIMGQELSLQTFEKGVSAAAEKLARSHEASYSVAQAMANGGAEPMQLSFSFELGAIVCKIGAVFKANTHVSPNMATTLVFVTTDVNITPKMLRKALQYAVNETLNLMDIDGISSPNDMVCIMANGRADNWRIDCEDTDYRKFTSALKEFFHQIALRILRNRKDKDRILLCRVYGAQSAQISRALAKKIVGSVAVKEDIKRGSVNAENILFSVAEIGGTKEFDNVSICIRSEFGEAIVYEDDKRVPEMREQYKKIFASSCVELSVQLAQGNYKSVGYTCI